MEMADVVPIQRPADQASHGAATLNLAKVNRKPVWIDFDDDLYAVPFSNPTHSVYSKPKTQNNVTTMIAKADLVTVSTPAIATKFQAILQGLEKAKQKDPEWILGPGKVVVIPNAYDTELLSKLEPRKTVPPRKLICWRGSATHNADLMTHAEPFCRAFGKHLDWTINMVGAPFWGFVEAIDKIPGIKPTNNVITESLDPINYFDFLKSIAPMLMVVPLEDNAFNRAKSNIVWLEGLHAGAITLAPRRWDGAAADRGSLITKLTRPTSARGSMPSCRASMTPPSSGGKVLSSLTRT